MSAEAEMCETCIFLHEQAPRPSPGTSQLYPDQRAARHDPGGTVTAAISGHGRRGTWSTVPACKCGWKGTSCGPGDLLEVEAAARRQYEGHKHEVRRKLNIAEPEPSRAPEPRRLTVVR